MSALHPMMRRRTFSCESVGHFWSISPKKSLTRCTGRSQCLNKVVGLKARRDSPTLGDLRGRALYFLERPQAADRGVEGIWSGLPSMSLAARADDIDEQAEWHLRASLQLRPIFRTR